DPSRVVIRGAGREGRAAPRVPHGLPRTVSGGGQFIVPNSPPSFSTHDGTIEGAPFAATPSIRLASAIEARYIIAEAEGNTPQNVAFLNEQRAVGGQPPLESPAEAQYF